MDKLPLMSKDVLAEKIIRIREEMPEVFAEGKIDFELLKMALGEFVDNGRERYGLTWAGKSEAVRNIQSPSVGTLLPVPEESVNFDTSENLIIEGDNLEVLKLLHKSYHGKIKLIYIDPPYNTGNEFIYPDNFREGLDDYLRYSGQVDNDGIKLSTNAETDGRFHSKWLNMMYPRLFLSRNLLREDGVVFVSIDDNEVHNLRMMLNEIFGEENFIANVVWEKKYTRANDARWFSDNHDHILVFAKNKDACRFNLLERSEEQLAAYSSPDNHPKGLWKSTPLHAKSGNNSTFTYTFKNGITWSPPAGTFPRFSAETLRKMDENDEIWFGSDGKATPSRKSFLSEVKSGVTPITLWNYKEVGHTHEATNELKALFPDNPFNNPKPTRLIRRMLELATKPDTDDIVLDFFAGSGTTAQSVIDLNQEDGGNRKFILVQLPEPATDRSYKTIAEITRQRVKRVYGKLNRPLHSWEGFRSFELSSSNFKQWGANADGTNNVRELEKQLRLFTEHVHSDRTDLDILFEILLKSGLALTAPVEKLSEDGVFGVAAWTFIVCLAESITLELVGSLIAYHPSTIVCLDAGFHGNDSLKTNVDLEMKSNGITFYTV